METKGNLQKAYQKGLEIQNECRAVVKPILDAIMLIDNLVATEKISSKNAQNDLDALERDLKELECEAAILNLTEKQLMVLGAWFLPEYLTIGVLGSNRSGKSYPSALAYTYHIKHHARPDSDHWCVSPDKAVSVAGMQKYLWEFLPKSKLGKWKWDSKNGFGSENPCLIYDERTADNPKGRNISVTFKTQSQYENNLLAFEAATVDDAWVDESVSHDCFGAIRTRVTVGKGSGKIMMSTIPSAEWLYEHMEHSESTDLFLIHLTWKDNPVMTPEKWEAFCNSIPAWQRAMRIDGEFEMAGHLVYSQFRKEKHVIKPDDIPDDLTYYGGLDVGMDHPTVWILIGVSKEGNCYAIREYVARNRTPAQDSAIIKPIRDRFSSSMKTYIDPAAYQITKNNPICVAQQYAQAGFPVSMSKRTSQFGEFNQVNQIQEMLINDELFICEECHELIREFRLWKYKRDRQGKPLSKDSFEDKNNDALDALRYVLTMNPVYRREGEQKARVIYG